MSVPDIDPHPTASTCISLAPTTPIDDSAHTAVHGVAYHDSFLDSLAVTSQRPPPHSPIRAISAAQFRDIHLSYLTSHAPDSIIFPFLHGLEGNNLAQNAFFANAVNAPWKENHTPVTEDGAEGKATKGRIYPEIPRFRGLVWVAAPDPSSPSVSPHELSSDDYDESSSSEDSEDDLDPCDDYSAMAGMCSNSTLDMDIDDVQEIIDDPTLSGPLVKVPNPNVKELSGNETHMHPVFERTHHDARDRRPSHASTASTSTTYSDTSSLPSPTTPNTSIPPSPELSTPPLFIPSNADAPRINTDARSPKSPLPPPLLTSSFRPHELLKPSSSAYNRLRRYMGRSIRDDMMEIEAESNSSVGEQGEFVDLKVPDGISLRNFGTQVPIFATLSDIVVYSPTGNIEAAKQLAQKFKDAVEKKYQDRVERIRSQLRGEEDWEDAADGATPRPKHRRSSPSSPLTPEEQAEVDLLLKYNVFVLDASPEDIYQHLEHLVARVEDVNAPHAHTDGTDAHTVGDPASPASASSDSPVDNDERRPRKKLFRANTVNFAQREKEEMRDLTRASELYTAFPPDHPLDPCVRTPRRTANSPSRNDTLPSSAASEERLHEISASTTKSLWDPSLGQIFMGNASDVPLPSDEDTAAIARREMKRLRRVKKASHHHYSTSTLSSSSYSAYQEDYQMDEDTYDDQMEQEDETFDFKSNDPAQGMGYDLCIECDDLAPFPTSAQMRAVEDHLAMLERLWVERCLRKTEQDYQHSDPSAASGSSSGVPMDGVEETTPHGETVTIPPRPPPNAASVVHLSFPSSVSYTPSLLPFITWLETLIKPVSESLAFEITHVTHTTENGSQRQSMPHRRASSAGFGPSSLPPPSAFQSSFLPSSSSVPVTAPSYQRTRSTSATYPASTSSWNSQPPSTSLQFSQVPSLTARHMIPPYLHQRQSTPAVQPLRTRPLKILIYSADGYTESSSLALCLLMAYRRFSLPESYLELQIEKKRSFFVYQNEVASLKRVESRMEKERHHGFGGSWGRSSFGAAMAASNGERPIGRPPAQSVSFAIPPPSAFFGRTSSDNDERPTPVSSSIPTESSMTRMNMGMEMANRRPRASTMSVLPSFADHQAWFNDPRFDGSFPSRVLPFLYLGNLNHASNVYMLHALGITHVVSVGECALVPPPLHAQTSAEHSHTFNTSSACQFVPGKGPGGQGSLWIEEREGRIKVLDIKGVCDDGIDTLEPQLEPICNWIDRARAEGGKVLVHCRVGVSRSATVTIAYVMKHLSLPLVDAYLIVRSRRLSVLIQPNMRLLYNLLGWEVKLAKERAGENEERLRYELSRCLNWPYLAREVHVLNEKYLH